MGKNSRWLTLSASILLAFTIAGLFRFRSDYAELKEHAQAFAYEMNSQYLEFRSIFANLSPNDVEHLYQVWHSMRTNIDDFNAANGEKLICKIGGSCTISNLLGAPPAVAAQVEFVEKMQPAMLEYYEISRGELFSGTAELTAWETLDFCIAYRKEHVYAIVGSDRRAEHYAFLSEVRIFDIDESNGNLLYMAAACYPDEGTLLNGESYVGLFSDPLLVTSGIPGVPVELDFQPAGAEHWNFDAPRYALLKATGDSYEINGKTIPLYRLDGNPEGLNIIMKALDHFRAATVNYFKANVVMAPTRMADGIDMRFEDRLQKPLKEFIGDIPDGDSKFKGNLRTPILEIAREEEPSSLYPYARFVAVATLGYYDGENRISAGLRVIQRKVSSGWGDYRVCYGTIDDVGDYVPVTIRFFSPSGTQLERPSDSVTHVWERHGYDHRCAASIEGEEAVSFIKEMNKFEYVTLQVSRKYGVERAVFDVRGINRVLAARDSRF